MVDDQELPQGDEQMAEASSDSDSSDSDFEELDISPEDTRLLLKLEQQLKENPNLYDSHVQFIEVLHRCKMTTRLREARQAMHAAFPLTEALWFDWLSDEIEGIEDAEDVGRIRTLMAEAVRDYLSIPLWAQYLEFVRDFDPEVTCGSAEGRTRIRELCEQALTAGGLHVSEGARLWSILRGFEQALLEAEPVEEQRERVRALWTRQLAVPLADGAATLAAYEEWERREAAEGGGGNLGFQVPAALAAEARKAQAAAELRQPYEEAVGGGRAADADLLAAYMAYVKVEERAGDPARVQVVYERAVAAFPVTHYLWLQYGRYLEAHLRIGAVLNSVYARAVRNCPWVGALWARALRALERSGAPEEEQAALFERALAAGMQGYEDYLEVALARVDALRRRGAEATAPLRAAFTRAAELLQSYFPDHLDRSFRLTSYWAECEARVCGDLAAARRVWEGALKGGAGRYADTWAAYIDFERRRGHTREARTLYKRCYSRRLEEGGQAIMCDAWLRFEREEGSADDHLAACLKVEPILQELQAAAAAAADPGQHAAARTAADKAAQLSREEVRAMRQQADPNYGKRKQRGPEQAEGSAPPSQAEGGMLPPPAKKPKTQPAADAKRGTGAAAKQHAPLEQQQQAAGTQDAPATGGEQQQAQQVLARQQEAPPHGQQLEEEEQQAAQQRESSAQEDQGRPAKGGGLGWRQQRRTDASTAFVKHLAEGVDEAAVRQLFEGCGQITGVEMGRDRATGRLKGFAYVHFDSQQGLEAACRLDRTDFRGKHIFVAPSKPPGGGGKQEAQAPPQQAQGRGGGGGGGDAGRGRGRGGRDGGRGRGGAGPRHRSVVDLGGSQPDSQAGHPSAPPRGFVPRAAALQGKKGGSPGQASTEGADGGAPKSNDEFRKMFLGGK